MKTKHLLVPFTLALGLGLALALLWLSSNSGTGLPVARAADLTVCPAGPPTCGYSTIQAAVDAANEGEVIKVAAGTYTGVSARPVPGGYPNPPASGLIIQVVYISKTIIIQGGYTTTNWITPDPEANPTTLDAQGQGRVIFITDDISPTVEGLRITGGYAAGLGGYSYSGDAGGGMYIIAASATISNNQVFRNTAEYGGGLYLYYSDATLSGNTVTNNTYNIAGIGGGLYLYYSDATLSGNTVTNNTAGTGGGLFLYRSTATLSGNVIRANTAVIEDDYDGCNGGGLYLSCSDVTLSNNTIASNTATGRGGGLYLWWSTATLNGNTVVSNAAARGGGLYLYGSTATLNGNTVTNNTATGRGGGLYGGFATLSNNTIASNTAYQGGGLYGGATTLSNNTIVSNTAADRGGGLYLYQSDNVLLDSNTISANTASRGGGVWLIESIGTLNGNTISANTAHWGGGLYVQGTADDDGENYSDIVLSNNTIASNTAAYRGGGLYLYGSIARLSGNNVVSNTADQGGGLYLYQGDDVLLDSNTISANTARKGGGVWLFKSPATLSGNNVVSNTADQGGGLYLYQSGGVLLDSNTISANIARKGGGVWLFKSPATLSGNTISANTAHWGGGLYVYYSDADLFNNVVSDNRTISSGGSGLCIRASSPRLLHTTIARNGGGDGSGLYVFNRESDYSTVTLIDTILVSHTVGITVTDGSTAMLEATLWGTDTWANGTDWGGAGMVITGTVNVWGNPAFVDPDGGDYHIGSTSAAHDAGVDAGVNHDLDGQPRPMEWGYDIGADEHPGVGLEIVKRSSAPIVDAGQVLTYTVVVTSMGTSDATGVVLTDTLDGWQRPTGVASSVGECDIADAGWGGAVVCSPGTMVIGTTAWVTLTAQVSTAFTSRQIVNTVVVATNEAANSAQATTYARNCRVRINDSPVEYTTIQAAVDAANDGDLIKVAGVCVGASERGGVRQQVYLDKSLTIRGGYTTTNWTTPDPEANPTTLDALGQGRVLYITGDISPTVEGLRITGGRADDLGGSADVWARDVGGGVYVITATATIRDNQVFSNTSDGGGGLCLYSSDATLSDNTVIYNTADYGGGLYLRFSAVTLSGNTVASNTAANHGGGLYLSRSDATLSGNTVAYNTAAGGGGGLCLGISDATLSSNTVISNSAENGGGMYLSCSDATLTNTIVADNQANTAGSGLYIGGSSPHLLHTTIARNSGGDGSGVYVTDYTGTWSTVALTNTILVSHTVGIYVTPGNTAMLEATLWGTDTWANGTDWGGAGMVITGTLAYNYWDDPAFAAPDAGDYHIGPGSAAIDRGVDAGVTVDIDGEPRPAGLGYDVGADECWIISPSPSAYIYLPLVVRQYQ